MRRTRLLIKRFEFNDGSRRETTLGSGVRMPPGLHRLELVMDGQNLATEADRQARTRLTTPLSAKRWIGFEAEMHEPQRTAVRFRLSSTGSDALWWNGSEWTDAGPGQWNTETEVATNIATYHHRALQVIVGMSTERPGVTPRVYAVKLLYESDVEFAEEYIVRSVIPEVRENLRPISDYAFDETQAPTDEFDLHDIEGDYNIIGIDSIYNLTDDLERLDDIYLDYDPVTRVARTSEVVPAGRRVLVRFYYRVDPVVSTSQDFTEFAKIPAVMIEAIEHLETHTLTFHDSVINRETGTGFQLDGGIQRDINFDVRWAAGKQQDSDRLGEALRGIFHDRLLRARGQDEFFRMRVVTEASLTSGSGQTELRSGRIRVRIMGALFLTKDAKPVFATKRLVASGSISF